MMSIRATPISVELSSKVAHTFRTAKVGGLVDYDPPEKITQAITAHVPPVSGPGSDWQIGAIIGPSGDGKSSIARAAYGDRFIESWPWPKNAAILDGFPQDLTADQIVAALTAAGLSSIPAYFQPYHTLSTGQRHRADVARALLTPGPVIAVDEFGGTVDQTVANTTAAAAAKAIRSGKCVAERFVAVGARGDFAEWLQPDWVLNMATRTLARGWVRPERAANPQWFNGRPALRLELRRLLPGLTRRLWPLFARHHYLTGSIHPGARGYAAVLLPAPGSDQPERSVGFVATNQTPGKTAARLVQRLVVLPDYQGIGIGSRLLEAIADIESKTHSFGIRTSHPAIIGYLKRGGRDNRWFCADFSRFGSRQTGLDAARRAAGKAKTANSFGRSVLTFRVRASS